MGDSETSEKKTLVYVNGADSDVLSLRVAMRKVKKSGSIIKIVTNIGSDDNAAFLAFNDKITQEMKVNANQVIDNSYNLIKEEDESMRINTDVVEGSMGDTIINAIERDNEILSVVLCLSTQDKGNKVVNLESLNSMFSKMKKKDIFKPVVVLHDSMTDAEISSLF